MSVHLSHSEMSAWLLGERRSASGTHLRECQSCRSAVEALEGTLADFRLAVRETGDVLSVAAPAVPYGEPLGARMGLLWRGLAVAGTALAAFLLAVGPQSPRSEPLRLADGSDDAMLMRQVDIDVSQSVPDSMEPLLQLLSSENSSTRDSKLLER